MVCTIRPNITKTSANGCLISFLHIGNLLVENEENLLNALADIDRICEYISGLE